MTDDDGRKPEGARERSPKAGVGAPSGRREWPQALFCSAQDGDCRAAVARRAAGTGARETNISIARLTEWRERALANFANSEKKSQQYQGGHVESLHYTVMA
jgi:hypothetical protein